MIIFYFPDSLQVRKKNLRSLLTNKPVFTIKLLRQGGKNIWLVAGRPGKTPGSRKFPKYFGILKKYQHMAGYSFKTVAVQVFIV